MGRNRQHNLRFVVEISLGREESPKDRNIAESRYLGGRLPVFFADEPPQNLRFAVPQSQHSRGRPRADLISQGPGYRVLDLFYNVADFEVHFHGDLVVPKDGRFHLKF